MWENEARESLKIPNPDKPVNRSWSGRLPGQCGQRFDFFFFAHFLVLWSFPYLFHMKSLVFMPNAKRFWFLVENWPLSKYMSIWCIWHEIHAIRRHIYQEFIKQSLDHKEITPSYLLISTNCSSLKGFVKISTSWSFVLTNSSVMSPFCSWSLRKWCI